MSWPSNCSLSVAQRVVIVLGGGEEIGSLSAVAPPIRAQALVKILDGIEVIVSQDEMPGHGLRADLAHIENKRHQRRAVGGRGAWRSRPGRADLPFSTNASCWESVAAMALAATSLVGAAA